MKVSCDESYALGYEKGYDEGYDDGFIDANRELSNNGQIQSTDNHANSTILQGCKLKKAGHYIRKKLSKTLEFISKK